MHWAFRNRKLWGLHDHHNHSRLIMTSQLELLLRQHACVVRGRHLVCWRLNSIVTCGTVVPRRWTCLSVILPYSAICNFCSLVQDYVDRLVKERRNSSARAMELRFSCTKPLMLSTVHQWWRWHCLAPCHRIVFSYYSDVIMGTMASQITNLTIVTQPFI